MIPRNEQKEQFSLRVERITGEINAALMSVLSTASTWLSPVPEAAMTTSAIVKIFELSPMVAALVAASLELVGINVNSRYLEAQAFNDGLEAYRLRYKATNLRYPLENIAGARARVTWFYVITGAIVAFTAFYEVFAEGKPLIKLLACLFPIASAIGTRVANERASFRRKVATISENDKQQEQQRVVVAPQQPIDVATLEQQSLTTIKGRGDVKQQIVAVLSNNGQHSDNWIADKVGCKRQYVQRIRSELLKSTEVHL